MGKVLSKSEMDAAIVAQQVGPLGDLVAPTANELLDLALSAFSEIEPDLDLPAERQERLRVGLRVRLIGALLPKEDQIGVEEGQS